MKLPQKVAPTLQWCQIFRICIWFRSIKRSTNSFLIRACKNGEKASANVFSIVRPHEFTLGTSVEETWIQVYLSVSNILWNIPHIVVNLESTNVQICKAILISIIISGNIKSWIYWKTRCVYEVPIYFYKINQFNIFQNRIRIFKSFHVIFKSFLSGADTIHE